MKINNAFNFGDILFLKTDHDQKERILTGINITPNGITYRVSEGINESYHFEIELSREANILLKIKNN